MQRPEAKSQFANSISNYISTIMLMVFSQDPLTNSSGNFPTPLEDYSDEHINTIVYCYRIIREFTSIREYL